LLATLSKPARAVSKSPPVYLIFASSSSAWLPTGSGSAFISFRMVS
jgi:hypothetical protein